MTPLKQLATISVPEATQLLIKPFDKGCLKDIEKAIFESNLGYTPNNDGESIRIVIPALTEDRRKELTKQVKAIAEDAKVSIRNARHEGLDKAKKAEAKELYSGMLDLKMAKTANSNRQFTACNTQLDYISQLGNWLNLLNLAKHVQNSIWS